eukprot:NP_001256734.1 Uncharacterized protein CELE_F40D4.13 [Caenorhabditis elegans]
MSGDPIDQAWSDFEKETDKEAETVEEVGDEGEISPLKTQENDELIEEDDDDDIIITKVTGEKADKGNLEGLLAQIAQQNSSSKDIVQLCNELKKLPSAPFGVPLLDSGSATAGTQLVMFGSLVKLLESSKQTTSDNNTAVGLIKSINGSLKSIVDGEKAANNAWRESTIVMLKKELRKLELARLEDKETQKDNWSRFHEWAGKLKKNDDVDTGKTGSTSDVPGLLKRGSSETVDAAKFGSKSAGKTPKEKILAAQAANEAKKKPVIFKCVLCVKDAHETEECTHYPTKESRIARMEAMNLCQKCVKYHGGSCHSKVQLNCSICRGAHQTFLCNIFEEDR